MKRISGQLQKFGVIILISFCINVTLIAQTPADDPGIGGQGAGVAPAVDGAPIVPFDGTMNLFLLASGVAYAACTAKSRFVVKSL